MAAAAAAERAQDTRPWYVKVALVFGALLCFMLAIYFAFVGKEAAGTLMAGMSISTALLRYLPEMESFKAFGLEAKMRQRLGEAEAIVEQLKDSIIVFGKISYHLFGEGSRMSHPVRDKQILADEVDKLLIQMKVDKGVLAEMKQDYLHYVQYDLNDVLQTVLQRLLQDQQKSLREKLSLVRGKDEAAAQAATKSIKSLDALIRRDWTGFPAYGFEQWCLDSLPPTGLLGEKDEQTLRALAVRVGKAGEACRREGRLGEDGCVLIEEWSTTGGTDHMFGQLFGRAA